LAFTWGSFTPGKPLRLAIRTPIPMLDLTFGRQD
jgi:hypothetical protein